MRSYAYCLPLILLLVGLLGCGASRAAEEGGTMPADETPTSGSDEATAVAFTPLSLQVGGTVFDPSVESPELVRCRDRAAWEGLWARLHRKISPAPQTPEVDFDRHEVLALLDQQRNTGGYSIRFDRIQRQGDRLLVEASTLSPHPQAMVTMALTQPIAVVRIPRQPDDVSAVLQVDQVVQGKP